MNIALFDYGAGNLHSLAKALEAGGARVAIEPDPARTLDADALVLPGVGAFGAAAARLAPAADRLRAAVQDGFPCLGICLGMQLLFEESDEGAGRGLGVFPGHVRRLRAARVPHMGWNAVTWSEPTATGSGGRTPPATKDPLADGVGALVTYYANSFVVEPADPADVLAWTAYEDERFAAAVRRGRCWGVQFHPEKSGEPGLRLIRNFIEAVR